jgi:ABC-type lipoprotein export system ATPase subunit
LIGYKQGLVVPFVSINGRSGSGKSTVVKFVCENHDQDIPYAFVNLRKASTANPQLVGKILGSTKVLTHISQKDPSRQTQSYNMAQE